MSEELSDGLFEDLLKDHPEISDLQELTSLEPAPLCKAEVEKFYSMWLYPL